MCGVGWGVCCRGTIHNVGYLSYQREQDVVVKRPELSC